MVEPTNANNISDSGGQELPNISDERLYRILRIGHELNQTQDIELLLMRVLQEARAAVNADAGSIYTVEGDMLRIKYAQNDSLERHLLPHQRSVYTNFSLPIDGSTIAGYAALKREMINIPDVYNIPPNSSYHFQKKFDKETGYRTQSSLSFPLVTNQDKLLGVLQLLNAKEKDSGEVIVFGKMDEHFLAHFASIATIALQRAKITQAILMRMIKMASLRDPKETGPHVNRVGTFSVELYKGWAQRRNISKETVNKQCDTLRMAAMLHDVGKVGISDNILKKPARFTEKEFTIMQLHTLIGADLFKDKESELDQMAREIALRHHENWDGSGYPGHIDLESWKPLQVDEKGKTKGLQGEEIPIWARIVGLCDVFDALASVRIYKPSWSEEDVLAEIGKYRGSKFDPELVDIFLDLYPIMRQIQQRYKD